MAEGGVSQHEGHSLTSGSEFVFDFYCELCRDDGHNLEAAGYCKDCQEYLCSSCKDAHKKTRTTRYHVVLDQASMPKDTPLSQDRVNKDISTKCQVHSNKLVEFFCVSHNKLGCSTCFATEHKSCANVESIFDKADTILESKEYKHVIGKMEDMGQRSSDMVAKTQSIVSSVKQNCLDSINDIRTLKAEVIAIFEELEQDLVKQVETMASASKETCERLNKEANEISNAIDALKSEFGRLATSKRTCQLYIQMKERASETSSLEDKLKSLTEEGTAISGLTFEPNNDIKNIIRASGLGKIVPVNDQNAVAAKNDENTTATHVTDIDITSSNDTSTCCSNGSVLLSDTALVLVDCINNSVKLVDTRAYRLKCELKVSAQPFDVAMINEKKVALSTWGEGKIFLITVTDTLSLDKEISVGTDCRGVAVLQDRLLVAFYNSKRLDMIDIHGNIIKKLDNSSGSKLFNGPRHVCVSNTGEDIYVSELSRGNKILKLSFENQLKSVDINREVSDPHGMCVDHCGNVFVADGFSRSVRMVTPDTFKMTTLLTQNDGLNIDVRSVSHCKSTNRLYVGNGNVVKVFQLSN